MAVFLLGLVIATLITYLAVEFFPSLGLLDYPERYGLKRSRLPYPGGLIFLVLGLVFFLVLKDFWFLSLALLILGGVSFWDDLRPLPSVLRLLVHVAVASFVFLQGIQIAFVGNPFSTGVSIDLTTLPLVSFLLTVAWIVIIQNAMNWFDGIRGLTVGVSGVGFLTLGIFGLVRQEVAWEVGLPDFLQISFFLAGICAGSFLLFWRGKILLGDSGSQVLGFLLAVMSIFAGTKIATTLLVLGLPILDAVFVVGRRVLIEKVSPFRGDKKHLHHNLSRHIGEQKTSLLLILISAGLGTIAIFLTGAEKVATLFLVVLFVFLLNRGVSK
ncbi:undecaprenyl/decaprenyl-phosphate alpha-N-acetylglucosaminyl 1-phosphate transferase [Candidatus Gracilibacteria bacterium]|nr:undecaprenyl/decaprenyl-phosphate alpha-N-acetylglucosaminyl 1-phosphate transferase [Candidatus Gracilibacteria bacterium]